jgi:thiol-disulfide isomerase/thioredoxin
MKLKAFLLVLIIFSAGAAYGQDKPESAGKIMDDACKLAAKEGKNVMIVFHASWCGWCKKFEASVKDPSCSAFFDKNFIIRYLDILERGDKKSLENPGAEELFNKNGGQNGGVPYFLIYDKKGTLLGDSKIKPSGDQANKPAENMGCPASEAEVAAFIGILSKVTKVSDTEKAAITERFKKNKS